MLASPEDADDNSMVTRCSSLAAQRGPSAEHQQQQRPVRLNERPVELSRLNSKKSERVLRSHAACLCPASLEDQQQQQQHRPLVAAHADSRQVEKASRMAGRARARAREERNSRRVPCNIWLLVLAAHLLAGASGSSAATALALQLTTGRAPADTILLENGSTVVVLTLDQFLAQSSTAGRFDADTSTSTERARELEREGAELSSSSLPTTDSDDPTTTEMASSAEHLPTEATTTGKTAEESGKVPAASKKASDQLRGQPTAAEEHDDERGVAASKHQSSSSSSPSSSTNQSAAPANGREPSAAQGRHHHEDNHHHHGDHPSNATTTTNATTAKKIPQHWQVRSLLNVTHDYPLAYSQIICGYVWPLMAGLTLFTNLMIVFVLTQRDMRTPTNVVLTAIAIADIIPIVVPVPWFVYLFAMGNEKQVLYPPVVCYFYQHSTRSISEVFYFLSTWLNVLLAVQDYLTACKPQLAQKYCQIRVVVVEIILLTFLAFLLNLPQALKIVFKPVEFYYNGQLTLGCRAKQARWFKDLVGEYVALYDDIFTAIIVLFVDGGPAVALITLTALLIRQLQRQRIRGHQLMEQARTASKRRRERHRQQESEASARVMIFVLLAFLAVKIPFATTYTLMIIQSRFEIHFVENLVDFQKAITLTDLVFVLSYPINFTIFCCCSKKFRHKCAQLLGECNANAQSAKDRAMRSFSTSCDDDTEDGALSRIFKRNSSAATILTQSQRHKDSLDGARVASNGDIGQLDISHWLMAKSAGHTNKVCDGPSHFDSSNYAPSTPPAAPGAGGELTALAVEPADFRAQLDDGSICIECIMRYERLKRFHQGRLAAEAAALAANSLRLGERQSQEQSQEQQQQQRRKSSQDSTSWPIGPPPPPLPPLRTAQLPKIITTRCESINEQPGSEDGRVGSRSHQQESRLRRQSIGQGLLLRQQGRRPSEAERALTSSNLSSELDLSAASQQSPTGAGHDGRPEDDTSALAKVGAGGAGADAEQSDGGRSRGLGNTLFGLRQLSGLLRRSSDNSGGPSRGGSMLLASSNDEAARGRCSSSSSWTHNSRLGPGGAGADPLEQKGRSLSMSDSKLTTLPNATGMLADIMMSTLLTSAGMRRPQAGGDSREAVSEPPIHLAAAARQQLQEPRRSKRQEKRQRSFRDACKKR